MVKDDDSSKGDEVMMIGKALARIFPEGYVVKSLIKDVFKIQATQLS